MADEILRSKHGFGTSDGVSAAIEAGKLDAFDVLFLGDSDGNKVGWIDRDGNVHIVENGMAASEVTTKIANAVVESKTYSDDQISAASASTLSSANAYSDDIQEKTLDMCLTEKYEITNVPVGTLINYGEHEIRVMCPVDTEWTLQNVGANGLANRYYITFKAYAPENAVSFKEDSKTIIEDDTMWYFENNSSAGIDKYGRKYSVVWLSVAEYDESTDTWTYFGAESTVDNYVCKHYSVEWYDADGVMIGSDYIRVNITNENCHHTTEPYYMAIMKKDIDTIIEEKIEEVVIGTEIVEF